MIITKDILDELMLVWLLLVSLPIHAQQKHDDTIDDVLQYVPYAMFAFAGATMLHHEYRQVSPWISVAGYGVATFTAIDRVVKERHHWYDAACGAGMGFLTAEATWWLSRKVFKKNEDLSIGFTGDRLHIAYRF